MSFLCAASATSSSVDKASAPSRAGEMVLSDAYIPRMGNYFILMQNILSPYFLHDRSGQPGKGFQVKQFSWKGLYNYNIAFLYAIRIKQSRFACCAGFGLNGLTYTFNNEEDGEKISSKTLYKSGKNRTECRDIHEAGCLEEKEGVRSSHFSASYINFLLRLRFNSVLNEPKSGFHGWAGVKLGFLMGTSTLINYTSYGAGASLLRNVPLNLHKLTCFGELGLGYHRFGLACSYALRPLFEAGKGPDVAQEHYVWSLAFYLDMF